jgi:CRP/FNR family transcriptional regulator, cyclic AMP receptor protein
MTPQELLRAHPFFAELAEAEIQRLLKHSSTRRVEAGHVIFHREGPGDGLYGVLSGRVAFTIESAEGKDLILNILGSGEFFGEIALLDGKGRTAAAIARDECELLFIGRTEFLDFAAQRPEMMLHIIGLLCARLRRATDYIENSAFLDLAARLAKQMIELLNDGAGRHDAATLLVSQEELARMLGVSRERVSRQLAAWSSSGIIDQGRGRLVVRDQRHLERLVGPAR